MLTGAPPYRDRKAVDELGNRPPISTTRLARYREWIEIAPADGPSARGRASIGHWPTSSTAAWRSIAVSGSPTCRRCSMRSMPAHARRARRPLVLLGAVGPALVLAVMSLFAWQWFGHLFTESDAKLRERALESVNFAAKEVALNVTNKLDHRYRAVEEMADSPRFQRLLERTLNDPIWPRLRAKLSDPDLRRIRPSGAAASNSWCIRRGRPPAAVAELLHDERRASVGRLVCQRSRRASAGRRRQFDRGIQLRLAKLIFTAGPATNVPIGVPAPTTTSRNQRSRAVFRSQATIAGSWRSRRPYSKRRPRASSWGPWRWRRSRPAVAVEFPQGGGQFAMLVDWRSGPQPGHRVAASAVRQAARRAWQVARPDQELSRS